jgi:hypothetical protein
VAVESPGGLDGGEDVSGVVNVLVGTAAVGMLCQFSGLQGEVEPERGRNCCEATRPALKGLRGDLDRAAVEATISERRAAGCIVEVRLDPTLDSGRL